MSMKWLYVAFGTLLLTLAGLCVYLYWLADRYESKAAALQQQLTAAEASISALETEKALAEVAVADLQEKKEKITVKYVPAKQAIKRTSTNDDAPLAPVLKTALETLQ